MKAKITTAAGTFEFEGTEEWVEKQITAVLAMPTPATVAPPTEAKTKQASTKKPFAGGRSVTQPRMLATLLTSKEEVDSLRDYYTEKQPITHIETFAVLTLWLRNNKDMKDASVDEMWTLYKVLTIRPPKSLIQTFRDGKSKKSYFESAEENNGRYFITSFGETFVDHDLPIATKGGK
ncbi:MAG TPA: hypothetical protein VFM68_01800 [Candidatus Saccharimonadales bacterium]|nr:hypothetical protein [Candidatus Saccharimonadales bacterium]